MIEKLKRIFRGNRTKKTENRFFPYLKVMSDMEEMDFLWFLEEVVFHNKSPCEILNEIRIDDSLQSEIIHLKKSLDETERRYRDYNIKNKIGDKHGRIYIEKRKI